ncbi:MAG: response regulator [Pseudomonadota bacterium]
MNVGEALRDSAIFNLESAVTMVVDDSAFALELTTQALLGFGIKTRYVCHSAAEAMEILQDSDIDLLMVDADMPGTSGYELVRWLRRANLEPNSFAPVILMAPHVRRRNLEEARDCGANFVITKPFSATTLLERVVWVARDQRPFLTVGDYFGPDRRFRELTPKDGDERREDKIKLAKLKAEQAAQAPEAES